VDSSAGSFLQQFKHPFAHGLADQHVGAGVRVVVGTLVPRGLCGIGPEVADIDTSNIAFEIRVSALVAIDSELRFRDPQAGETTKGAPGAPESLRRDLINWTRFCS